MSAFSNYAENRILNHIVGQAVFELPVVYIALFNEAPTEAGGGTEVSGAGYQRIAVSGLFADAVDGSISTAHDLMWDAAEGAWGTIVGAALMDAEEGGNVLVYGEAASPKTLEEGDSYRIPAGALTITLD